MVEIDKLALLLIKNQNILLARSRGNDTYYIPGGKREEGESDHEALIREIKEEISIDLIPNSILYANTFTTKAHNKPEDTVVKMTCYFSSYTGNIVENSEIEETLWASSQTNVQCSPATLLIINWLKLKELIS